MEPANYNIEHTLIFQQGQATIGDLRIGAAAFGIHTYTTDENETITGPVCGLWFYVRDHEELDRSEQAYPGKTLEIAGYYVNVDEIEFEEGQRARVFLSVARP